MKQKKKFNYTGAVHQVSLGSTISAIGDKTEYFYTGCGTFLRDDTAWRAACAVAQLCHASCLLRSEHCKPCAEGSVT